MSDVAGWVFVGGVGIAFISVGAMCLTMTAVILWDWYKDNIGGPKP